MNTIYNATKHLTSEFSIGELLFGIQYIQHEFDLINFISESNILNLNEKDIEFYLYLSNIQSNINKKSMEDFIKTSCIPLQWIIGYQIESTKERNGYVLILDHNLKSLCLYINGTQNFTDLITDLEADSIEFQNGFAHKGMYTISKWYIENLKNLISNLLKENENYEFLIIGHSLGAGIASILSLNLIEEFPNLKCIGFACPSCLSENLSKKSSNFITSFINQNDFVPRFSIQSVKEIKKKLPENWKEIFLKDVENTESTWMKSLKKSGAIEYLLKEKKNKKEEIKSSSSIKLPPIPLELQKQQKLNQKLFPAGNIFHLFEIENEIFLKKSKNLNDYFDLILNGNYIEDHKMIHYFEKFQYLKLKLKKIKNDENFDEEKEKEKIIKILIEKKEESKKKEVEELKEKEIEKLKREQEELKKLNDKTNDPSNGDRSNLDPFELLNENDLPPIPTLSSSSTTSTTSSSSSLNDISIYIKLPPKPSITKMNSISIENIVEVEKNMKNEEKIEEIKETTTKIILPPIPKILKK